MKVLKFGGSSLATPATVRAAAAIVLSARKAEPVVVVVSAFQGVTNQLIECARLAEDIVGHPLPGSVMKGGSLERLRAGVQA